MTADQTVGLADPSLVLHGSQNEINRIIPRITATLISSVIYSLTPHFDCQLIGQGA